MTYEIMGDPSDAQGLDPPTNATTIRYFYIKNGLEIRKLRFCHIIRLSD